MERNNEMLAHVHEWETDPARTVWERDENQAGRTVIIGTAYQKCLTCEATREIEAAPEDYEADQSCRDEECRC